MVYFDHTLDLPYSNVNLKFKEINTSQQIFLCKLNLSLQNSYSDLYEFYKSTLDVISDCVKNYDDFKKIDIIEYVLFMTKLRCISNGSVIEFMISQEDGDISKKKVILNLNNFIKKLLDFNNIILNGENNIIQEKNIKIFLKWPSLNSIDLLYNSLNDKNLNYDFLDELMYEFISHIEINNITISFKNFSIDQKKEILNSFTSGLKNKIQNKILEISNLLISEEFLTIDFLKNYKFNFYNLSFIMFVKIFFSFDIRSIYKEIYALSVNGLNTKYILDMSPNERKIYFSIINENNKSQDSGESQIGNNKSLEDLAVEFNQVANK
jgi:hypothetical protein